MIGTTTKFFLVIVSRDFFTVKRVATFDQPNIDRLFFNGQIFGSSSSDKRYAGISYDNGSKFMIFNIVKRFLNLNTLGHFNSYQTNVGSCGNTASAFVSASYLGDGNTYGDVPNAVYT